VLKGLYILDPKPFEWLYGPDEQRDIASLVDIYAPPQTRDSIKASSSLLAQADVIISGWGAPLMDEAFLAACPRLRAVFYGGGTIRGFVTQAFWTREIVVTSSAAANAIPVSEYTLAVILLSLKHFWSYTNDVRREGKFPMLHQPPGAYHSTVGLISLGMIGRLVRRRLRPFDLRVLAYDPFLSATEAAKLEVELIPLERIFQEAEVVSLHTPWLKETEDLITGAHFASMKPRATFINTSRGAIVREPEMIEVLQRRPDLTAVLDVTHPEPPVDGSRLYTLPNVVLSPHIAGSMGGEYRRMGRYMVHELRRFVSGQPLKSAISEKRAALMA